MDITFLDEVLKLYRAEKWKELLKLNENSDSICALKLLWVWPSEKNLRFLEKTLVDFGCRGVTSIGCGCGLLEWLINRSIGFDVIGYEINQEWWTSKYSNPQFIKLRYCERIEEGVLRSDHALLFCYFNNRTAFLNYVGAFRGRVVIIIGPGEGKGRHTDPEPFTADFGCPEWRLDRYEEVKDTKDFIAVYARCTKENVIYK